MNNPTSSNRKQGDYPRACCRKKLNVVLALLVVFSSFPGLLFAVPIDSSSPTASVDFNRDIRPILSQNCFACHGFDQAARQGDLRLDVADQAARVFQRGEKNSEPEFIRRILSTNPEEQMPPPDSHHKLTESQIKLLQQWVQEGAVYSSLWSLSPPKKSELPKLNSEMIPKDGNEIDHFIRARLQQENLAPSPEADRYTLIRRVYLDLLGLPPSAIEIQAFIDDQDPDAYPKLVKKILESPHFGERLALEWLDVSRYADTNGYSIDGGRHMWLWRDWVIQAFNDNKPYDRFLIEQLAGDLLEFATDVERIATGFQRNNMVTHEGGTIPEENLANYSADRVKTFGEAVLGITLACAQCHDHKYDPISQKEYYQLAAFFNTIDDHGLDGDGGKNPEPSIMTQTPIRTNELPDLNQRIEALEKQLAAMDSSLLERWKKIEREKLSHRGANFALLPVKLLNITTPNMGGGFNIEGDNSVRLQSNGLAAFDMSMRLPETEKPIDGIRVTFHPMKDLPGGGWGRGVRKLKTAEGEVDKGTFVLTHFSVTAGQIAADQVNIHQLEKIKAVTASSWLPKFTPEQTFDSRNHTGWSPALEGDSPQRFTISFENPIEVKQLPFMTLQLNFGFGQSMIPAKFDIQVFSGTDDDVHLPQEIVDLVNRETEDLSENDLSKLWTYCAGHCDELWHERTELENLKDRKRALSEKFSTMVMRVAKEPRETFVLERGDYFKRGEKVFACFPEMFSTNKQAAVNGSPHPSPHPSPDHASDQSLSRMELAKWLTGPEHPLTSRVAVNRFWKMIFGQGIVATTADFGSQGTVPSHPELLDWLAVDFQEHGWDVKRLLFQMVTSATYKQSSFSSAEALKRDPENVLLARGPRFRLSAEAIRDAALKTSGLLVPRIGGPSVNPYTPGDPWREVSHFGSTPATSQSFVQDHGEKLYRRSLYTYWKRTAPPVNMVIFDAPNREVCTPNRQPTNTPLQSFVLLNDTQFVEASRKFAERIVLRKESDPARLSWAFLEAIGRPANDKELQILLTSLDRERKRYKSSPDAAIQSLKTGESRRNREISCDETEQAAWKSVASTILNLSEFVTRH